MIQFSSPGNATFLGNVAKNGFKYLTATGLESSWFDIPHAGHFLIKTWIAVHILPLANALILKSLADWES